LRVRAGVNELAAERLLGEAAGELGVGDALGISWRWRRMSARRGRIVRAAAGVPGQQTAEATLAAAAGETECECNPRSRSVSGDADV
jgi:hypothetical protein